jgi:hypothetical protein
MACGLGPLYANDAVFSKYVSMVAGMAFYPAERIPEVFDAIKTELLTLFTEVHELNDPLWWNYRRRNTQFKQKSREVSVRDFLVLLQERSLLVENTN